MKWPPTKTVVLYLGNNTNKRVFLVFIAEGAAENTETDVNERSVLLVYLANNK